MDLFYRHPQLKSMVNTENSFRIGGAEIGSDLGEGWDSFVAIAAKPVSSYFQTPYGLLEGFTEGAADGHYFPTDFIWVVKTGWVPGNFSKAKRGILVTT